MITSRQHPRVKELVKLRQHKHRQHQGLFVAEGLRLVADGLAAGWKPVRIIVSPPLLSAESLELIGQGGYPIIELSPDLMARVGDTESSQGIMAVFPIGEQDYGSIGGDLVLVLNGLKDPGNVGTLFRSGSAVGIGGLIATAGTVDLTAPKVVRASMGGIFRIPWLGDAKLEEVVNWAHINGWRLVTLEPRGGTPFHRFSYEGKVALVVGSETEGISREFVDAHCDKVTIPMPGGHESLNAAMAATLVLYQAIISRGTIG